MLPTFLVLGAQKSGTTSLWAYLKAHPEVYVPEEKEPRYFLAERGWQRGREWYEGLFADAGGALARGEASPDYTVYPVYSGVPERIASVVPDVRLVYLMRHPIERLLSSYLHAVWDGVETRTLETALLEDARYLYRSQYAMQIEQYLAVFPRDQLLLLTAEQLREDRAETMRRVLTFIGVSADRLPDNLAEEYHSSEGRDRPRAWARAVGGLLIRSNAGRLVPDRLGRVAARFARAPMPPEALHLGDELAEKLRVLLRPDLVRLGDLMGPGFDCWGLLGGTDGGTAFTPVPAPGPALEGPVPATATATML